jgi:hypothetical protein
MEEALLVNATPPMALPMACRFLDQNLHLTYWEIKTHNKTLERREDHNAFDPSKTH